VACFQTIPSQPSWPRREREADRAQRRPHPLLRFRDGPIAEPDQREGGKARLDRHLRLDLHGLDPGERDREDAGNHRESLTAPWPICERNDATLDCRRDIWAVT
jgi:hypothetical protein